MSHTKEDALTEELIATQEERDTLKLERDELVGLLHFLMYEAPNMRISDHDNWRIKIDRVHSILTKCPEPQPTKEPK